MFKTTIPGNVQPGEQVQEFTIPKQPVKVGIQENIKNVAAAVEAVKGHCMCANFSDDGEVIEVIYPAGDWPGGINGVRGSYGRDRLSKTELLKRLLDRMEKHWVNSFPGAK